MKLAKLALLLLFITFCTEDNNLSIENNADEALENESNNQEDLVDWDSALGKSPEIFVSTWNSVVNSISNDEETILFFSINEMAKLIFLNLLPKLDFKFEPIPKKIITYFYLIFSLVLFPNFFSF